MAKVRELLVHGLFLTGFYRYILNSCLVPVVVTTVYVLLMMGAGDTRNM